MNDRLNSGCSNVIVVIVIVLFFIVYKIGSCDMDTPDYEEPVYTQAEQDSIDHVKYIKELRRGAEWAAKQYVKATLKNPRSADFPLYSQSEYQGDSTFLVGSYVDAQNSFGAIERMRYNVKLTYLGGEIMYFKNWFVLEIKTDDK